MANQTEQQVGDPQFQAGVEGGNGAPIDAFGAAVFVALMLFMIGFFLREWRKRRRK